MGKIDGRRRRDDRPDLCRSPKSLGQGAVNAAAGADARPEEAGA
jgi:hypothetical protein